jgi:hypothetical protein
MTAPEPAIVLFGDVVDSRRDATGAAAWLRDLCLELDERYADDRLAPFGFTQGDELQGLLRPNADPFAAILAAGLRDDRKAMRWVVVFGEVAPGRGPATERSGPAFIVARRRLAEAKVARDGVVVVTGADAANALLDDLAPLLATLVDDLTPRQRTIARLILVDGLRQSAAADRLGVSRATVSVVAGRGRVRHIGRLVRALGTMTTWALET